MRIVVRIPHAISSPTIGVIRHLGAEMEPVPESNSAAAPSLVHPVASWVRGRALTAEHYRPVWQGKQRLYAKCRHQIDGYLSGDCCSKRPYRQRNVVCYN